MTHIDELKKELSKLRKYNHALNLLYFDFETTCPKDAFETESDTLNYFSNEAFKIRNSKKMKNLIVLLNDEKDQLEYHDRLLVEYLYDNYLKTKNITPSLDMKMNKIYSKSYIDWLEAKKTGKYSKFRPIFKKVIDVTEEAINLRENKLPNLYDNMLNDCEEGMLQEDLDSFFSELKVGLIELLNKIKNSKHQIRTDFLNRNVPIYKQKEFSDYLLKINGYNFDRGYVGETEHPFTSSICEFDARVTTHYHEDMFLSNMFSIIHEGGHAIFMQNEPSVDHEHFINDHISNGMHESVSRFYENVIGRSEEYIHLIYPKFKELFGDIFSDVSERELYEAINLVEPSLIRTEADEVTYGLHIIIRYEMEKMICNKKIDIKDINKKWNELYFHYLGVKVPNDREGVLQDVHWTSGFGYFPSYALGNAYNAMYVKKMRQDINLDKLILEGNFEVINNWMKENVFKEANHLKPKEWLYKLCGKNLDPKDFLDYLHKKYSDIYKF